MKLLEMFYRGLHALLVGAIAGSGGAAAQVGQGGSAEELAWQEARARGDMAGFERYLELYPAGEHASDAFRCVIVLSQGLTDPACALETAAGAEQGGVDVY